MTPEMKAILDALGKAFEEFKASNNERLTKIEAGHGTADLDAKLAKINTDINGLEKERERLNKIEALVMKPGAGGGSGAEKEKHSAALRGYMRNGDTTAISAFKGALQEGVGSDGGFAVTEEVDQAIDRVAVQMVAMRGLATVRSVGTSVYKKIVNIGGTVANWVGETQASSNTATPAMRELAFPCFTIDAQPLATSDMLEDAFFNAEAWLGDELGIAFSEKEGAAFISGSGAGQPKGITSYATIANANYSNATHFGNTIGHIASGAAGAFGTNPMDKILNLIHALKPAYRVNAKFLMSDTTANTIRQIKDGDGNYMWNPNVQTGQVATLFGYPVAYDDNMPVIAANSLSVAFADFRRAYVITDRRQRTVLRDPFSNKPYIAFYTTQRVGGGVQNHEAIKLLKFAAA